RRAPRPGRLQAETTRGAKEGGRSGPGELTSETLDLSRRKRPPTARDTIAIRRKLAMNQRARFLTVGLLALLLLGGGAFLFHVLFWQPLENLKSRIASVRKDLDTKEKERDSLEKERQRVLRVDPRLGEWRKISLPESPGRSADEMNRQLAALQVNYE